MLAFLAQTIERRARRRELLLTKAIDLAARRTDTVKEVALRTGVSALLKDDVSLTAEYFVLLQHLIDKNDLPDEFKEKEGRSHPGPSSR